MKALVVVDIQNDFLPGGALSVQDGDRVIPIANQLMPLFALVVTTQDWHPTDHGSFAVSHQGTQPGHMIELGGLPQVLWPVHCVQSTPGADFPPALDIAHINHLVHKGSESGIDSYSGFFDNGHRQATGLHELLQAHGIDELYLLGLATDYCVKYTALDARFLGYPTVLVVDGCRGVNLTQGDVERAIEEMREAGVKIVRSEEIVRQFDGNGRIGLS